MLTVEEIKERLQDRRIPIVSEATGLSYPTIQKIRDGESDNPSYKTMQRLSEYLEGKK
jgi:hypothetical protein